MRPMGEAVPVIVLREGKTETLQVTLGRREDAEAETMPASRRPATRTSRRRWRRWA
jgi:serine protease Do